MGTAEKINTMEYSFDSGTAQLSFDIEGGRDVMAVNLFLVQYAENYIPLSMEGMKRDEERMLHAKLTARALAPRILQTLRERPCGDLEALELEIKRACDEIRQDVEAMQEDAQIEAKRYFRSRLEGEWRHVG